MKKVINLEVALFLVFGLGFIALVTYNVIVHGVSNF
jgi:hypothetical protein